MTAERNGPSTARCRRPRPTCSRDVESLTLAAVGVLSLLAACERPVVSRPADVDDDEIDDTASSESRAQLVGDLQDDILSTYRDPDSLAFENAPVGARLIDPDVGPARIGVGPADVRYGSTAEARGWHRWPLAVAAGARTAVRSKRLDIHLSIDKDVSAAWMSDEVSWEIQVCGKTAALPIRITALYARDGDQWLEVFEHLSYGRTPVAYPEPRGARMVDAFSDPHLVDYPLGELGAPLAALLSGDVARIRRVVSLDPQHRAEGNPRRPAPTFLLGPAPGTEWHGDRDVARARLHVAPIYPEDRRVTLVGAGGTVAYWIGNFIAELPPRPGDPGGKVRLRGTFVFEKRCSAPAKHCVRDTWVVVQGHVSEPIDDDELARGEFGTALSSDEPLRFNCGSASRGRP